LSVGSAQADAPASTEIAMRLLIVDDNETNRELICALLAPLNEPASAGGELYLGK
jgi:hypothetical protein